MTIRIDYSNMLAITDAEEGGGDDETGGIPERDWTAAAARFEQVFAEVERLYDAGMLGFLDLPDDNDLLLQTKDFAYEAGGVFDDVVILGIGGSALGPIALRTALRPSGWNALDDAAREGKPRLHVLDNVDPETIAALLGRLVLARTLFVVTSKSGGTAETMAQFLVVYERLEREGLDAAHQMVFVTDPERGALRTLSRKLGIEALDIPANVGGRFSIFTPVGLLPAALMGIDVDDLLDGAADMARRCESDVLRENPAGVFAMLQWIADTRFGRHIHVLMPYADALRDFASWYVQLWAESLGKIALDGTHVGPTPLAALGATDQHSQVQLFMEGPADKTVTFLAVTARSTDVTIPTAFPDVAELSYLGGHTLGELIDIEQQATAGALAKRGRPNMTIHLDTVDAWHVGGLVMLLELATIYAGELYGVNPLDQPGVELGKNFAYALLGRADAGDALREWDSLPKPDPRRSV